MASVAYEEALRIAEELTPEEQARLRDHLAQTTQPGGVERRPRRSSYGVLKHLGQAPSIEDIDGVRREMWANFPRDDIA